MIKTKLLIFYLFLFSLLFVPSVFAVNEVCSDGTNNCCSTGPNCPAGEYWNGESCAAYTACSPGESFFCSTGTCSADYCATAMNDPAMAEVCCADGEMLVASDTEGGWTCAPAATGSGATWNQNGSDIYYDSGNVSIGATAGLASFNIFRNDADPLTTYGAYIENENTAYHNPARNVFGLYSSAEASGPGNFDTAYGIYTEASNLSLAGCPFGADCVRSYGIFSEANGENSRGGYFRGEYRGVQAVIDWSSTDDGALALLVEQHKENETAARFECDGTACTSAVFLNGNDVATTVADSGYVIVGSPTGQHLVLDPNEVMAKTNSSTGALLWINYQSGDTRIGTNVVHVDAADSRVGIMDTTPSYTLQVNGSVAGVGAYINASDGRWKKNSKSIQSALDTILSLEGKIFEFRTDEFPEKDFDEGFHYGFIAQEVEKILPEVVSTDDDGYKNLAYSEIVPILVEAMKEQQQEIDELKTLVCSDHPEAEVCK